MKYLDKINFIILVAVVSTSCSKTQESIELIQEIVVTTNISQQTKAPVLNENGSGQFTAGDEFSIYVTADNANNQLPYIWGTTKLKWNQIIKENPALTSAYFSANYPSITTETPQTATFDVATASNPDLLLAPKVYLEKKTGNPLNLSFQHAMHMLRITYVAQEDLTQENIQNTQTSCTALSTCSINLLEGTLTQVATDSEKEWPSQSGTEVFFVIPPQGTENVSFKITTLGVQKKVSLSQLLKNSGISVTYLKGGNRFEIKLRISESGIQIENSQISGWGNQGSVDGELLQKENTSFQW